MITYEQIKTWWKEKENKQKVVLGICYVLVFFVGFGSGSFTRQNRRETYKPQSNYTTSTTKKPATTAPIKEAVPPMAQVASASTTTPSADCIVKGNIGAGGKKMYHVKGGAFYARTKAEQCFNTEAEAQAAGFIKSSR